MIAQEYAQGHDPKKNTAEYWLWVVLMVSAVHVLEEHEMNWLLWSRTTLGFAQTTWDGFYVTNMVMEFFLIGCAMIGWRCPAISLSGAALIAINAVFFHILPTVVKGVYSPGTVTAVLLYLPVAYQAYRGAFRDQVLSNKDLVISGLLGVALMGAAVVLQLFKGLS